MRVILSFETAKKYLINNKVYKSAIMTDSTNKTIYLTIPYGQKNGGQTKIYKVPSLHNCNKLINYWRKNVDQTKVFNY